MTSAPADGYIDISDEEEGRMKTQDFFFFFFFFFFFLFYYFFHPKLMSYFLMISVPL